MSMALVTGAHGFIGRHLARFLHRRGIHVCGIGHGAWDESERTAWGVSYWFEGDVSKANLAALQAKVAVPDLVFHLAGGASVGNSLAAPGDDFRRSVGSAVELLEWARQHAPASRLLLASSGAVYGAGHTRAIRETDKLRPQSPYAHHKRMAEELFAYYGATYGLNVSIVRLFSVYGPGLRKQLLWDICSRLRNNSACLALGGTGEEVRDWLHVDDAIEVLCTAIGRATCEGAIVNGGTGVPLAVRDFAIMLCGLWGENTRVEFSGVHRPGDPQYLVADTKRLISLGVHPKVSAAVGVADYVTWFKGALPGTAA